MGLQRYERVSGHDEEASPTSPSNESSHQIPASPPPSFRSHASSPTMRHTSPQATGLSEPDRTLADTFDAGGGSDEEDDTEGDDRQRLMRTSLSRHEFQSNTEHQSSRLERRVTELPAFVVPTTDSSRTRRGGAPFSSFGVSNDGVFANLDAKPELGEKAEEQPPSYEQAAADATPPYWETTILAPGMASDEVYVDGLPVGSLFSFVWNAVISMSFQLVGFLLTYLLHTTHAAKNGSRAGLGVILVQYGFYMKSSSTGNKGTTDPQFGKPTDPNSHDFDPSAVSTSAAAAVASMATSQGDGGSAGSGKGFPATDWLAYVLMIAGWFILIRAVTDFMKARRHEQLVLQSPERGLTVPIVAEGEQSETVV